MIRRILCLVLCLALLPAAGLAQEAYAAHPALSDRSTGPCTTFTGPIRMMVVYVSTPDMPWTPEALAAAGALLLEAARGLEQEAAGYGAPLQITFQSHQASADGVPDMQNSLPWAQQVIRSVTALPAMSAGEGRRSIYCANGLPILFLLNGGGRGYACCSRTDNLEEYVVLYVDSTDTGYVRHELLHLYGAQDLYQHGVYEQAARENLPRSIMLTSDGDCTVDPLTAYLVGWTDRLDPGAEAFLAATAHVTRAELDAAFRDDTATGSGTSATDSGVYNGDLVDGERHGYGTLRWNTGDAYTGAFRWGKRTGTGVYRWANGAVYTGDLVDGVMHGAGYHLTADGTRYLGDVNRNDYDGRCYIAWPDGDMYLGDIASGLLTGRGLYVWPDGSTYYGDFVEGARTGMGAITLASGDAYVGDVQDGAAHGTGMYRYADGSLYCGEYENGLRSGTGTVVRTDGTVYSGGYVDDVICGQGMITFPGGDVYVGGFEDGMRSGFGIYTFADGSQLVGRWQEDQLVEEFK